MMIQVKALDRKWHRFSTCAVEAKRHHGLKKVVSPYSPVFEGSQPETAA